MSTKRKRVKGWAVEHADAEMWKPVVGWEGTYSISSHGRVRAEARTSKRRGWPYRNKERYKKLSKAENGTLNVYLTATNGKRLVCCRRVHRLVAEAFLAPPIDPTWIEVNHKDGNRHNNHYLNLEWIDRAGNIKHGVDNGLFAYGNRHWGSRLTETKVKTIKKLMYRGWSNARLSKRYKVSRTTINDIRRGKTWVRVKVNT